MTIYELNESVVAKIASIFKNVQIKFDLRRTDYFKIDGDTECRVMFIKDDLVYTCKNFKNNDAVENLYKFDISNFIKKLSKQIYELLIDKGELNYIAVKFDKIEPLFTTNDKPISPSDPIRKLIFIGRLEDKKKKLDKNVRIELKFNKCDDKKCEVYYNIEIDLGLKLARLKNQKIIIPKKVNYNY